MYLANVCFLYFVFVENSCCKPHVPKYSKLYSDGIFTVGHAAYIECDKGYVAGGEQFRECQQNDLWSGQDTACTSMSLCFVSSLDWMLFIYLFIHEYLYRIALFSQNIN